MAIKAPGECTHEPGGQTDASLTILNRVGCALSRSPPSSSEPWRTMKPRLRLLACSLLLVVATVAAAQVPPDKAVATLKAADDLQVELFAAEPMLINPTSIDVDHRGRVWVCEAVNYRRVAF